MIHPSLGDVDVRVLVPDEVDVGDGEVLAGELAPVVAGLVEPLGLVAVLLDQGHAGLVAEAVSADRAVGLLLPVVRAPVIELQN